MRAEAMRWLFIPGLAAVLGCGFFAGSSIASMDKGEPNVPTEKSVVTDTGSAAGETGALSGNYASLPELVEAVCGNAMDHFYNFFSPGTVDVLPLEVVGELPGRRVTALGITIADQMAARVSNDSLSKLVMEGVGQRQKIGGILQELDGYLRIHIDAVNVRGERRSYVINVEMSELLYRALHTFISG
ncbi:MAG: hypothetical protein KKG47_15415 [Proteobacteria bacterium]|nr:hypothetical protein [Pseudomonadota bacterium]MBU1737981.1 hypothetical protein [Pseudomonadota bacterium]